MKSVMNKHLAPVSGKRAGDGRADADRGTGAHDQGFVIGEACHKVVLKRPGRQYTARPWVKQTVLTVFFMTRKTE